MRWLLWSSTVVACASGAYGITLRSSTPEDRQTLVLESEPYVDDPRFREYVSEEGANSSIVEFAKKPYDPFKGEFGHLLGERTAKNKWEPMDGPQGGKQWTVRILIWPATKFAFCWIDKNAGTQFNLLMNKLNKVSGVWFMSSWNSLHAKGQPPIANNQTISRENGWKMGIFLRDPAERFLSSWSAKCQEWEDQGKNCLGDKKVTKSNETEGVEAFEMAVKTYLPMYFKWLKTKQFGNAHYDPQSDFCGGRGLSAYDFVGTLSDSYEHIHDQVFKMFSETAGVPESNTEFWNAAGELFPKERPEGHGGNTRGKMQAYYRDPQVYQAVVDAYKADYDRFGLKSGHYE